MSPYAKFGRDQAEPTLSGGLKKAFADAVAKLSRTLGCR